MTHPHLTFSNFDAILFDMDGVMVDTLAAHRETWAQFARKEGIDIDMDWFMEASFGRGNNQVFDIFYRDKPIPFSLYDQKGAEKEEIFLDMFRAGKVSEVEGLFDFIDEAQRHGLKLAIGSSAPRRNIEVITSTYKIRDAFGAIVSMNDVTNAKPDPEIFLKCCQILEVDPHRALVLEDSFHGLTAAKAAGCHAVAFATTHTPEELDGRALGIVGNFRELIERMRPQHH